MATKKASAKTQSNPSSDMAAVWKWVYVAGVVVAGVAGAFGFENLILSWVLLIVGLLVGFFYFDSADLMNFGLRYLVLGAVSSASATFLGVAGVAGAYVSGFFTGFFNFLGPVVLAMIIMFFWKKYFGSM